MDLKTALLFLTDGTFYTVRLCDYYRCFEWLDARGADSEPVCTTSAAAAADSFRLDYTELKEFF